MPIVEALGVGPLGQTLTRRRPPVDGKIELEPGVLVGRGFEPVGEVRPHRAFSAGGIL